MPGRLVAALCLGLVGLCAPSVAVVPGGEAACVSLGEETLEFLEERPFSSGLTWASGSTAGGAGGGPGECWARRGVSELAGGEDLKWDLTLIESGFSACSVPAWINDTARFQVGENDLFSVSRESCSRQGQYAPPARRRRFYIFADYQVADVEHYRTTELTGAWLVEPESLCPSCYEYVRNNLQSFDVVLSHDDDLIEAANAVTPGKGIFCNAAVPSMDTSVFLGPDGSASIGRVDEKRELVSLIASSKTSTSGHRLRHDALRALGESPLTLSDRGGAGCRGFAG